MPTAIPSRKRQTANPVDEAESRFRLELESYLAGDAQEAAAAQPGADDSALNNILQTAQNIGVKAPRAALDTLIGTADMGASLAATQIPNLAGVVAGEEGRKAVADYFAGQDHGMVKRAAKGAGYDAKAVNQWVEADDTPTMRAQRQETQNAKGLIGAAKAYLTNPTQLAEGLGESAHFLLGSIGIARAAAQKAYQAAIASGASVAEATAMATKAAAIAGSAGEGAMTAGSVSNDIASQDGVSPEKGLIGAVGAGASTALIGRLASRIPGMGDLESGVAMRGIGEATEGGYKQAAKGLVKGGIQEGLLEEMPQSGSEQAWTNLAQGKSLGEGVPEAMGAGLALGATMGGPIRAYTDGIKQTRDTALTPTIDPNTGVVQPLSPDQITTAADAQRVLAGLTTGMPEDGSPYEDAQPAQIQPSRFNLADMPADTPSDQQLGGAIGDVRDRAAAMRQGLNIDPYNGGSDQQLQRVRELAPNVPLLEHTDKTLYGGQGGLSYTTPTQPQADTTPEQRQQIAELQTQRAIVVDRLTRLSKAQEIAPAQQQQAVADRIGVVYGQLQAIDSQLSTLLPKENNERSTDPRRENPPSATEQQGGSEQRGKAGAVPPESTANQQPNSQPNGIDRAGAESSAQRPNGDGGYQGINPQAAQRKRAELIGKLDALSAHARALPASMRGELADTAEKLNEQLARLEGVMDKRGIPYEASKDNGAGDNAMMPVVSESQAEQDIPFDVPNGRQNENDQPPAVAENATTEFTPTHATPYGDLVMQANGEWIDADGVVHEGEVTPIEADSNMGKSLIWNADHAADSGKKIEANHIVEASNMVKSKDTQQGHEPESAGNKKPQKDTQQKTTASINKDGVLDILPTSHEEAQRIAQELTDQGFKALAGKGKRPMVKVSKKDAQKAMEYLQKKDQKPAETTEESKPDQEAKPSNDAALVADQAQSAAVDQEAEASKPEAAPADASQNDDHAEAGGNDRDSMTFKRADDNGNVESVTLRRGDYVAASLGRGKQFKGDIAGISHAKKQVKIGQQWFDAMSVYPEERPEAITEKKVPLSSVVDSINAKQGQSADLGEADRVDLPKPREKIDDYGQKIGGAAKDRRAALRDALTSDLPSDKAKWTLAQAFPEPNYQALYDEGATIEQIATIKVLRDSIGARPRHPYKLQRWAEKLDLVRGFAAQLADPKDGASKVESIRHYPDYKSKIALYIRLGFPDMLKAGKADLRGVRPTIMNGIRYPNGVDAWVATDPAGRDSYHLDKDDALAVIQRAIAAQQPATNDGKETKFDLYRLRGSQGVIIGKKIAAGKFIDLQGGFGSVADAKAYLAEHQTELEQRLAQLKATPNERRAINNDRIGHAQREGDVTPAQFAETFGFDGRVEFGNSMPQDERQRNLNKAYDAFADLAQVLGIPREAISLNAELGLGFGSRGTGGKEAPAAHYERDKIAINLTRKNGAGSLGHEWWHALDNYFSRMRGNAGDYTSENTTPKRSRDVKTGKLYEVDDAIRPEMLAAFEGVVSAIRKTGMASRSGKLDDRKSKAYWGDVRELTARAFERFLIDRAKSLGIVNDYLANINSQEEWDALEALTRGDQQDSTYPYPTQAEADSINQAFDAFFQTLQVREEDGRKALYSVPAFKADQYDAKQFANKVQQIIESGNVGRDLLRIGDTPAVLQQLGAQNLELVMPVAVVKKAINPDVRNHNVSAETLKQLPSLIANPVAVMSSATENNALVVLVKAVDQSGSPIIVAVHLSAEGTGVAQVNKIASVYGKDNIGGLQNMLNKHLRYVNMKEATTWLHKVGLQLPETKTGSGLNSNVLTERDIVKDSQPNGGPIRINAHPTDIRNTLRNLVGPMLDRLESKGVLSIVRSDEPFAGRFEDGKLTLNATYLHPNQALAVLLHEIGHASKDAGRMFGKQYDQLQKALDAFDRAQSGKLRNFMDLVNQRVEDSGETGDRKTEERLMYAIEEAALLPKREGVIGRWFDMAMTAAKAWIVKGIHETGFKIPPSLITPEVLAKLARLELDRIKPGEPNPDPESNGRKLGFNSIANSRRDTAASNEQVDQDGRDARKAASQAGRNAYSKLNEAGRLAGQGVTAMRTLWGVVSDFQKVLPSLRTAYDHIGRMDGRRLAIAAEADKAFVQRFTDLASHQPAAADTLSELMTAATLWQIHPDQPVNPRWKAAWKDKHAELAQIWASLPSEARQIYQSAQQFYADRSDDIRAALTERIEATQLPDAAKKSMLAELQARFDQELGNGPYFPLARHGDYRIVAERDNGTDKPDRVVHQAESQIEAESLARAMEAKGYTTTISKPAKASQDLDMRQASELVGKMADLIGTTVGNGKIADELLDGLNQIFIDSLPLASARKAFTHRKGVAGYSLDMRRALAGSAVKLAGQVSKLEYAQRIEDALDDAQAEAEASDQRIDLADVVGNVRNRVDSTFRFKTHPVAAAMQSVGFAWTLAFNLSSAAVNLLQQQIGAAKMGGTHGLGKSEVALFRALKEVGATMLIRDPAAGHVFDLRKKGSKISTQEAQMLESLEALGKIDMTSAMDAYHAAHNDTRSDNSKMGKTLNWLSDHMGVFMQAAEVVNRQAVALAAFRLELAKNGGDTTEATRYAAEVLDDTQFNMNISNQPTFMHNNAARVVLQYKTFAINMADFLGRTLRDTLSKDTPKAERLAAARTLGNLLLVQTALAGLTSLPLYALASATGAKVGEIATGQSPYSGIRSAGKILGAGFGAALMAAFMMGALGDDDEPWDWKADFRAFVASHSNGTVAQVLDRGLLTLVGIDIADRISMNGLILRDAREEYGKNAYQEAAEGMISGMTGVAVNKLVFGVARAMDAAESGEPAKIWQALLPTSVANAGKGIDYAINGLTSAKTGVQLLDLNAAQAFGQFLGFSPAEVREKKWIDGVYYSETKQMEERRGDLMDDYLQARSKGNEAAAERARTAILRFNDKQPDYAIGEKSLISRWISKNDAKLRDEGKARTEAQSDKLREKAEVASRFR